MYTEIKFKLTSSRKIEIKLTDSVNQGIRAYYYYWMNTIFTKKGTSWYSSDSIWFPVAYYDYTNSIKKNHSQLKAKRIAINYVWRHFFNRKNSKVLIHDRYYNRLPHLAVIGFVNDSSRTWLVRTHWQRYIWVPTESDWYKKRHFDVLRGAVFEGIEDAPDNFFNSPIHKLARFKTNNSSTGGDFEHCFMIHEDMQVDKK